MHSKMATKVTKIDHFEKKFIIGIKELSRTLCKPNLSTPQRLSKLPKLAILKKNHLTKSDVVRQNADMHFFTETTQQILGLPLVAYYYPTVHGNVCGNLCACLKKFLSNSQNKTLLCLHHEYFQQKSGYYRGAIALLFERTIEL